MFYFAVYFNLWKYKEKNDKKKDRKIHSEFKSSHQRVNPSAFYGQIWNSLHFLLRAFVVLCDVFCILITRELNCFLEREKVIKIIDAKSFIKRWTNIFKWFVTNETIHNKANSFQMFPMTFTYYVGTFILQITNLWIKVKLLN